ncbi:uncharacterized protein LOC105833619 [Monomorium pharaonis]|uniref:uncharacterized protein LOC105833619 n=1 Tax=Monomorium pharaonis TaxID=307658 RepID=UPI00063EED15|nr:uncharacterized protein LOC105833619 [Monomorium pharaonis]
MSNSRRATRPVRQLSLQQPVPRRQHLRRQRSAEDDCGKSLQIYANPITRGRLAANATEKPKVRVAWGEDRRDSLAQVEVVARQIPSRSRPTTGRSGRTYATTEKASILYSRQELAERLRLAWKHREQNKANIDIFLAHNVEERCDSQLSLSVPSTPLPRKEPNSIQDNERKDQRSPAALSNLEDRAKETCKDYEVNVGERLCGKKLETVPRSIDNDLLTKKDETATESVKNEERDNEKSLDSHDNLDAVEEEERKKKTRINIDCTSLHLPAADQPPLSCLKMAENADPVKANADFSSAKQKRASFHSGTNRAFLVPMVEKLSPSPKGPSEAKNKSLAPAKSIEIRCASALDKSAATKSSIDRGAAPLTSSSTTSLEKARRTSSAPPQRRNLTRVQVNIVIDAPGLTTEATDKLIVCEKVQDGKEDAVEKYGEGTTKISRGERSTRSAPLKRRSRSAKRRLLASGPSKDEDRRGRGRAFVDPKTSDVVTMVSLVSSADSDSDVENSPCDDKLISELRSKLPTTPIIKTSINPNPGTARKPIKSVSFQRDSFDEEPMKEEKRIVSNIQLPRFGLAVNVAHENSSEDLREQDSRTVIDSIVTMPTLAVEPILIPQDSERTMPEAPLTDREKRCLAVPIGDLHDKKRKLLRTRSTSARPIIAERTNSGPIEIKEQRIPLTIPRVDLVAIPSPPIDTPLSKIEQFPKETVSAKEMPPEVTLSSEPHFQTTKEKECWHLYRRMCDKGVCVSFDTVLRGMLTPTEYRLRQKEYSQDLP